MWAIPCREAGKDTERVGYQYMKQQILRKDDTLVIKEVNRLSRNKSDIKHELKHFKAMGTVLSIAHQRQSAFVYHHPYKSQW